MENELKPKIENLRALLKATPAEEPEKKEDDEDEYDAEYMKAHMVRYMKENGKQVEEMAKKAGLLKKAADAAGDGLTAPEAESANGMMLFDGVAQMKQLIKAVNGIADAYGELLGDMALLKADALRNTQLIEGIGASMLEQSVTVPPPKGQQHAPGAHDPVPPTGSPLLQKAQTLGQQKILSILMKAGQAGNAAAATLVTAFESVRGNVAHLTEEYQSALMGILENHKE